MFVKAKAKDFITKKDPTDLLISLVLKELGIVHSLLLAWNVTLTMRNKKVVLQARYNKTVLTK